MSRELLNRTAVTTVTIFLTFPGATHALTATPVRAGGAPPLVTHWAPIIYHDTDATRRDDYLTRFDFDGDWDPWNNQENMESGAFPLIAVVYYSTVETETHHYLTYAFFHPYDSSILAAPPEGGLCILHENDVEGVILTIRKDGSPFGTLRVMATEAHEEIYYFKPDPSDVLIGAAYHDPATGGGGPDSTVYLGGPSGTSVATFIEANGHGVGSQYRAMVPDAAGIVDLGGQRFGFIGGNGVIYFHDGAPGEEPPGVDPIEMIRYALRPMDELWTQRHNDDPGQPYCDYEDYVGERGCRLDALAVSFGGTCWPFGDCAANPPWGWESDAPGSPRGDWFLDPAHVTGFRHLVLLPERDLPGFEEYVSNPFLQGDKELVLVSPVTGAEWVVGEDVTIEWTHSDVGQGPDLAEVIDLDLDRGSGWEPMAEGIPIGSGEFTWTVTPPVSDSCRVRVAVGTDCVLTVSDRSGPFRIRSDAVAIPAGVQPVARVRPARPNPFSTGTTITYDLGRASIVHLRVYDAVGREVRSLIGHEHRNAGRHDAAWDGRTDDGNSVVPGVYFYRLEAGGRVATGRVTLVR